MTKAQIGWLLCIIALGAIFRFIGINWDANAHLHPDERFLTMIATDISWPKNPIQYFDTSSSPLNPHNKGFSFYVYGTYPVHLVKTAAQLLHQHTYDGIPLIGRSLSAIADLITLLVVFLIARYLTKNITAGLYAAFCYAVSVLPIQLSHFFTVDPYVTLFSAITLWYLVRGKLGFLLGVAVSLAIAAKVSALLLLPIVLLAFLAAWPWTRHAKHRKQQRIRLLRDGFFFVLGCIVTLRVAYPYLLEGTGLNPQILANWRQLASFDTSTTTFPPGLQWIGVSFWQPIRDLLVWGLGFPLGALALSTLVSTLLTYLRTRTWHPSLLVWVFVILVSSYQSAQFAKPMRYLYPIYPALAVLTGMFLFRIRIHRYFVALLLCLLLIWPIAFISIYSRPHTRIAASDWIYANIPPGKTIAWEHWDDPLPLALGTQNASLYQTMQLPVFDPDSPKKWEKIRGILDAADYIVLSSNRGYGAIAHAKMRYPQTNEYYQNLFSGRLGFGKVAQFTSRPTLVGIEIIDDRADESFTVYDHPKVIIFQKQEASGVKR